MYEIIRHEAHGEHGFVPCAPCFRSYRENSNTRLSGFVHSWIKLRTSLYSAGVNCCLSNSIVRTTSIVFPLGVIVRVTLPKGLLITCSFVEVCNFMPSAGVTV